MKSQRVEQEESIKVGVNRVYDTCFGVTVEDDDSVEKRILGFPQNPDHRPIRPHNLHGQK
jgi:hypothetical protein